MMNEGLETTRAEAITATFAELVKILQDPKIDIAMRLKAAKQIDSISDTMVHAYLVKDAVQEDSSTKKRLASSIDKLHKDHGEQSE